MKVIRFTYGEKEFYGIQEGKYLKEIQKRSNSPGGILEEIVKGNYSPGEGSFPKDEVKILPPCSPTKVICLGLNYRTHAQEFNQPIPEKPILFIKPSTSVTGSGEAIILPPHSKRVDYEAELGVVIGKKCYRVEQKESLEYVAGYTCANDVTARDLQPKNGQWAYSKGFDTFAPLGPCLETEIDDPENLGIRGYLNGKLVQQDNTKEHIFCVAYLIEYISHCMTLLPGDVIMTGTTSGVGPLQPGDNFEVEVPAIGTLYNHVKNLTE